ncbi:MAG: DUF5107 domain-containing protein, partial [Kiritimatiellae bacterium]|nr:DUF5107 domain-containing protein [Kiritimatiellia bacterium]
MKTKGRAGRYAHSDDTRIRLTRETLPIIPFDRMPRSAPPRLSPTGSVPQLAYAGVPEGVSADFNRNLEMSSFPYPRWTMSDGKIRWQTCKLVTLENARWRVAVCPDFACRVMSLFDKHLGVELLWQSPVLRQAWLGLAGAWTIGGIEFNAFRFGHQVHGQHCLRVERVRTAAGWDAIVFGAVDELFGCSWQVTLAPLSDCVAMRVRMTNHSNRPQPGYWWTNIAVPMHNRSRVFYHPGPMLYHGFAPGFVDRKWPFLNDQDWSYWPRQTGLISAYLYRNGSDYFGYGDALRGYAMAHHADRRICKGRKLWSLGAQYENHLWWQRLAEHNVSSYAEMQCGRCPTQVEADLLDPGQVVEWTESFTAFPWNCRGEYPRVFAEYEARGAAAMAANAKAVNRPEFWEPRRRRPLVEADPRAAISEKVVLGGATVRSEEIERVVRDGWVGGADWIALLEKRERKGRNSASARLTLAAAQLDASRVDRARDLLTALCSRRGETGAQAGRLLAQIASANRQWREAERLLREALVKTPGNGDIRVACHQALIVQGKYKAAAELWRQAPQAVLAK